MNTPAPIGSSERIESIDVIRGIALLGIFIMNTPYFGTSIFAGADGSHLFNASYDRIAADARDLLFSGKFNSMFSALFAIGFTIQYSRLQAADPSRATAIYVRRLLVLLGFGIIHGYFIWIGDILHTYALLGLVLVLGFNRLSDRWVWVAFALTMVVPPIINLSRLPLMTPVYMQHELEVMKAFEASTNQAFGHGTFLQMMRENMRVFEFGYLDAMSLPSTLNSYFMIASTMLLGLLAGRHRWIQRAAEFRPLLQRFLWISLAVGLALGGIFTLCFELYQPLKIQWTDFVGGFSYRLCRLVLTFFYVCGILLLLQSPVWKPRLSCFALTGRMALSNYLLQTAVGLTVFYGWGFGLWNQVGPLLTMVCAIAFYFIVQVPLSRWWLASHRFGPMEWLWRALTYGRLPRGEPLPAR
jgi:uncharacterized protein